MKITVPYAFGDIVYLKTDEEQLPHEIVGVVIRPGCTLLEISRMGEDMMIYDFQITTERDLVKKFTSDQNVED